MTNQERTDELFLPHSRGFVVIGTYAGRYRDGGLMYGTHLGRIIKHFMHDISGKRYKKGVKITFFAKKFA